MSIIRALFLLLVGASVGAGQQPNPRPQKPAQKSAEACSVEGVVVKSTTGEGIKRATIQLAPIGEGLQPYSTMTEDGGRFTIHGVAPGRYMIFASGNGYFEEPLQKSKANKGSRNLELAPGQTVSGLSFRLLPAGVITGTVYDEGGEPLVLARVNAMRVSGPGAHRQVGGGGTAQTNDLGEYRIWGLQPGKYLVAATYQPAQNPPNMQSDEVYLPTFHPSTPDTAQAVVVAVEPGVESSGVDVDIRQAHAVTVRGRVMADGVVKSLRGTYISLLPRAAGAGNSLSSFGGPVQDDAGDFEIRGVPPGPYSLSAFWNDGKRQFYGKAPVEVSSSNVDGVTFILGGPMTLAGRIRIEGSNPFDATRLGLWLLATDNSAGSGNAEINPDGSFVVRNVYDGTYRIRVAGFPEEYYVKSAREGGSDILESGMTVSRSQPPSPLEVVLTPGGGRVDGSVLQDQHPVSAAWIVLAPDPPHRDREEMYSTKSTDSFGRFSLLGLPPGDFKLFAWEPVQGTNYTDPEFLEAFEGRGTPVHITEGRQQTVQLELITAEEQLR